MGRLRAGPTVGSTISGHGNLGCIRKLAEREHSSMVSASVLA